jgi:hypothetical protein
MEIVGDYLILIACRGIIQDLCDHESPKYPECKLQKRWRHKLLTTVLKLKSEIKTV